MPDVRTLSQKNKYYLPKHEFLTTYHYALQYNEWREKYRTLSQSSGGHELDGQPRKKGPSNPTQNVAVQLASLAKNIELIETIVREVAPDIYKWLLAGVTNERTTYKSLLTMDGIPCSQGYYYDRRRKFYFELARRM